MVSAEVLPRRVENWVMSSAEAQPRRLESWVSPTSNAEKALIDAELRENGVKMDMNSMGLAVLKFIGLEAEISPRVARGKFIVNENSCQPHGVLGGGTTAHIAESLTSAAGAFAAAGRRIAGIEMNVNHLRGADIGTEVTAIAKSLMHGNRLQVWDVMFEATTAKNQPDTVLIAVARVTLIVGLPPSQSDKANNRSSRFGSKL